MKKLILILPFLITHTQALSNDDLSFDWFKPEYVNPNQLYYKIADRSKFPYVLPANRTDEYYVTNNQTAYNAILGDSQFSTEAQKTYQKLALLAQDTTKRYVFFKKALMECEAIEKELTNSSNPEIINHALYLANLVLSTPDIQSDMHESYKVGYEHLNGHIKAKTTAIKLLKDTFSYMITGFESEQLTNEKTILVDLLAESISRLKTSNFHHFSTIQYMEKHINEIDEESMALYGDPLGGPFLSCADPLEICLSREINERKSNLENMCMLQESASGTLAKIIASNQIKNPKTIIDIIGKAGCKTDNDIALFIYSYLQSTPTSNQLVKGNLVKPYQQLLLKNKKESTAFSLIPNIKTLEYKMYKYDSTRPKKIDEKP